METTTRPCVVHSAMNDIKKKKYHLNISYRDEKVSGQRNRNLY